MKFKKLMKKIKKSLKPIVTLHKSESYIIDQIDMLFEDVSKLGQKIETVDSRVFDTKRLIENSKLISVSAEDMAQCLISIVEQTGKVKVVAEEEAPEQTKETEHS